MPAVVNSPSTRVDACDAGVALASAHLAEAHAKCLRFNNRDIGPKIDDTIKRPLNNAIVPVAPPVNKSGVNVSPIADKKGKSGAKTTDSIRQSASPSQKLKPKSKISRPSPKRQSRLCFTRKRNNTQITLDLTATQPPRAARPPGSTSSNKLGSQKRSRKSKQMPDVIDLSLENTSAAPEENVSTSTMYTESIGQLRSVFMDRFSDTKLSQALAECGGDVNAAVMKLL